MQSIEEIKKANELSKILKKHGLASDNIESYNKAKAMTQEINDNELVNSLKLRLDSLERSKHQQNNELMSLKKEVEETKEAMKTLYSELESLRNKIRFLEQNRRNQTTNNNNDVVNETNAQNSTTESETRSNYEEEKKNESIKKNPRMAELTPDLAIDKIFYYGQK